MLGRLSSACLRSGDPQQRQDEPQVQPGEGNGEAGAAAQANPRPGGGLGGVDPDDDEEKSFCRVPFWLCFFLCTVVEFSASAVRVAFFEQGEWKTRTTASKVFCPEMHVLVHYH